MKVTAQGYVTVERKDTLEEMAAMAGMSMEKLSDHISDIINISREQEASNEQEK